ncbi:TetR family transcriptional regulator [Winogradskya humida]|uniref:TetR family transcriptional regulator n=1 Tax=Winogradskya humida TaxID=113566 RepID=A0ABQ3ZZ37_9ACTN|nr:TetR family transcriptional regulator [Actinoplanes humidus]GIE23823.1 TetR family transcriptional regulator [Actinoplanes humidus]
MADGQASRRRLLDAAAAEFATWGLAGARVDRIATTSKVNKQQMYAWFGNKTDLFDAIWTESVNEIVDAVPLTADDLPGYATRLYDAYLGSPHLVRLSAWARLERIPTGNLYAHMAKSDEKKHQSIADAQAAGHIDTGYAPQDVHSLVIAMSMAWSPASTLVAASPEDTATEHARRKKALATAVDGAFRPKS